jgi:phosphodiesterase/alkaline phosphatase D-like protein
MPGRSILTAAFFVVLAFLFTGPIRLSGKQGLELQTATAALTHGPLVGDVRPDHAQIWLRTNSASSVTIAYGLPGGSRTTTLPVTTASAGDFTASILVDGLTPATAYEYEVLVNGVSSGVQGFKTSPPDGEPGEFSIAVMSDSFGYNVAPVYAGVASLQSELAGFMIIGDHDHDNPGAAGTGDALLNAIRKMHRRLRDSSTPLGKDWVSKFPADLPMLLRQEDDHDTLSNDCSSVSKGWPQVFQGYREYHPLLANNGLPAGMWQRTQRGRVAFVSLDLRSNRHPPAAPGGATILGTAQKAWLQDALFQLAGDPTVTWVAIVSTTPFNPAQTKQDSWSGYPADRTWLLDQIEAAGLQNVLIISGDCHWGSIDDGTHSILPELNVPQTNVGFSNTCSNHANQWTWNQTRANPGFGVATFRSDSATLAIHDVTGAAVFSLTVPAKGQPPICVRSNPAISLSPAQSQPVQAGTAVTYTLSLTNKDSNACSASSFALQAAVPAGWASLLGDAALTLSPGAGGTTTLRVTSPAAAGAGAYPVGATATNSQDGAFTASASAQYVVAGVISSFADDFNRADGTALGINWQEVQGDLRIGSNRLTNGLAGANMAISPGLFSSQQTAAADFASASNNSAPRFGIILRYQDPQNYYLLYRTVGGVSRLNISRVSNGVEQVLKYAAITNPAQNSFSRLEGQASGTTLKLLVNGAEKVSVTDAGFASGSPGIFLSSGNAGTCLADNFSASAR